HLLPTFISASIRPGRAVPGAAPRGPRPTTMPSAADLITRVCWPGSETAGPCAGTKLSPKSFGIMLSRATRRGVREIASIRSCGVPHSGKPASARPSPGIIFMRRSINLALALVLSSQGLASGGEAKLVRYPDYHGGKVTFAYLGDIWT